ncbi:MAG: glycosyl transferase family 51 [Verrucomicrobiales bacterium]|nr:glycosyl transferase family 51 [Verrucomicrobiales bacterium]
MIGDLIKIKPDELPARRAPGKPFLRRKWVQRTALAMVLGILLGIVGVQIWLQPYRRAADAFDLSQLDKLEESSIVYDRAGRELGRLADENRELVTFSQIPAHFIEALVATEDSRYWEHNGVDWKGVARATVWNTIQGSKRQGASTITQQLARQTFQMYKEKTFSRKIREAFVAERIERTLGDKKKILELYLNRIFFGSSFYGIGAAARGYFNKEVKDLTLEEAALLVGLIKNPNLYNPISGNKDYSLRERNEVFDRMVLTKKMSAEQAAALKAKPLEINPSDSLPANGYLQQEVQSEVDRILEQQGYEGISGKGFRIHTTVDAVLQRAAENSISQRLSEIEKLPEYPAAPGRETPAEYARKWAGIRAAKNPAAKKPEVAYLQGAALVIDNKTGVVLSMVGGREFKDSQFNRVTQAKRAAGTAITPFVYATAFEGSSSPGTRVTDKQMDNKRIMLGGEYGTLGEWGCETLEQAHENEISYRQALAQGKNNCAARVGLEVGTDKVKDFAKRAGLGDVSTDPAMLLGRQDVSIRDMALAYSAFPNEGVRPTALSLVTKIENAQGEVLYQRRPDSYERARVTDPITAWMVHSCLEDTLAVGTGAPARDFGLKDYPAAGKSGTHLNYNDLWFAGYDSAVTCVVWAGLDRGGAPVYPNAFGNRVALPIWVDIMNASQTSFPAAELSPPKGIEEVELCQISGKLATDSCLELRPDPVDPSRNKLFKCSYLEYFRPGFRMTQVCDVHSGHSDAMPPPPVLLAPALAGPAGVGMAVDVEESIPVPLKAPTVVGSDPYNAITGEVASAGSPGSPPPRAGVVKELPMQPFTPSVSNPAAEQNPFLPRQPKATVD